MFFAADAAAAAILLLLLFSSDAVSRALLFDTRRYDADAIAFIRQLLMPLTPLRVIVDY